MDEEEKLEPSTDTDADVDVDADADVEEVLEEVDIPADQNEDGGEKAVGEDE